MCSFIIHALSLRFSVCHFSIDLVPRPIELMELMCIFGFRKFKEFDLRLTE